MADVAAGAKPVFLSKNYINGDSDTAGGITVTTGTPYRHRAYDMTRTSKYTSAGSNDDTLIEIYTCRFYEGSGAIRRTFNFLALLGMNLKNFIVEYLDPVDGVTWQTVPGTDYRVGTADYAAEDLILSLTDIDSDAVRIRMFRTRPTANQEKELGDFIVAALRFQPAVGFAMYRPEYPQNVKSMRLASGKTVSTAVYRSDGSFTFWRAHLLWRGISDAQRDEFYELYESPEPLIVLLEPGDRPSEARLCRIAPSSYSDEYIQIGRRACGWNVEFDLEEIGGG